MNRAVKTVFAVAAAVTLLVGCSKLPAPEAKRNEAGAIEKEAQADAFSVKLGDCLNDPGDGNITSVRVVPCSEPHELEVFHEFNLEGDQYPASDEDMEEQVLATCDPVFETFVGRSYEDSDLDYTTMEPTQGSWSDGDRAVVCMIANADYSKVSGTLKGSNS